MLFTFSISPVEKHRILRYLYQRYFHEGENMSKRKKKMTLKQMRSLVVFLVAINIILLLCILVMGFFLAKAQITKGKGQTVMLQKANDTYTVCVDAGHGGSDVGAVGLDGSYEKDDNLRLAQEVAKALKKSGVNVIMTRSDDSDTQLDSRSKIANKAKADIFVSLHRNSTANPNTTKGIEIWIHSSGSERSYAAADDILSNLEEVGITANRGVRIGTQGDSDDDYAVIRDTDMTSMIVEMGFMTNQDDLDYFNENLENYAKAISNGVVQWLNDYVQ
ncbi:N-acetylmuramoyl-L-alanine amidase [Coprococcus sp. BIOML-A1]|jgi:N-acetylmuramoyl-L-alanine amidase|nr:N-acetylmuramoyl-L-alanine amidase [Coprococcus sp. BIOML-A1]MZK64689.1 N-acetylmuramoyl-L-alanine amidase [Coprococcus sp. BIOML-A2]NSE73738.1 N-acetylmuramoyl-L-alanine amidase [Coprococcus eutactus]RHR65025.1 N-acetylmuramoyl-L-alanine amidase [Coprococcus sp. AF16-5]